MLVLMVAIFVVVIVAAALAADAADLSPDRSPCNGNHHFPIITTSHTK